MRKTPRPTPRNARWPAARLATPLILIVALALAGVADARTASFGSRTLKVGVKGKDVRVLQRSLSTIGYSTTVDGAYGKRTATSVKQLEASKGWPVNGVVTRKDARRIRKLLAQKSIPAGVYYTVGAVAPSLTLNAQQAGTATVEVVSEGARVAELSPEFGSPGPQTVGWTGIAATGAYAAEGTYQLRLASSGSSGATVTGGQTSAFLLRNHAFPVLGPHNFGGAGSRFGAPRVGHTHQGQDVAAACGTKLLVAEGGTLRVNSYQASGAGYYVVIHGAISGTDYVYMHMLKASWGVAGQPVYTGQQIGKVGNTGSSQGCHLHFEHWTAPGWYLGGSPSDPLFELLAWDLYS